MNKTEFVKELKERLPLEMTNKEAKSVVDTFLSLMEDAVRTENELSLAPFGKFVVVERAARKGRNPQTGEELQIPKRNVVKFKPSKSFKESV